jgi:tetratricopeptide (TPR) repeat protein
VGDDGALEQIEYALALAEKLDLPETLAHALINKAIRMLRDDRLFEARALLEAAAELALSRDFHVAALRAYNNLGVVLEASDRFRECEELIVRAIGLARRIGDRSWESSLVGGAIPGLVLLGRWDEALARAAEGEEIAATTFADTLLLEIVPVHCLRGEVDRAREAFERSTAGESEEVQALGGRALAEARIRFAERRYADALAAAERAVGAGRELGKTSLLFKVSLAEALDAALALGDTGKAAQLLAELEPLRPGELTPLLRAQQARFRARLQAATGVGEPEPHFAAAERLFRELELQPLLATTLVEHAEWLLAGGHGSAEPLLTEAGEIFGRLEATPWLERIATAEGARPAEAVA